MTAIPAGLPRVQRTWPAITPRLVRAAALTAAGTDGALHWAGLLHTGAVGPMLFAVALGVGVGLASPLLGHPPSRSARLVGVLAVAVLVLAAILVVSGLPRAYLAPREWDRVVSGIGHGIGELPGVRVPYRGGDGWVRIVMLSGGALLLAFAGMLALAPRRPRPAAAAICLVVLYTVPIVEAGPGSPYLDGAIFAALLAALLWGPRLRPADAAVALPLVAVVVLAAALLAPRLDRDSPWIDPEQVAESLQGGPSEAYSWDHSYRPVSWTRDGTVVARIRSSRLAYWKTAALEEFDGRQWRVGRSPETGLTVEGSDTEESFGDPGWRQALDVDIEALRSRQFIGAGSTFRIFNSTRGVQPSTPGTFVTTRRPLRRGDSYKATAYVPRPSPARMRAAGSNYPPFVRGETSMVLPPDSSGRRVRIDFGTWDDPPGLVGTVSGTSISGQSAAVDAEAELRASAYGRVYDLARALRAESTSPYAFIRRVQAALQRDATYTENPDPTPRGAEPLADFILRTHAGYCQHFSGAMALMLRMGGVPARVASGFSPGTRDDKGDIVVRDVDAHSWVEAYFPRMGWVTFDPTPGDSPARSQITDTDRDSSTGAAATPGAAAAADRDERSDQTAAAREEETTATTAETAGSSADVTAIVVVAAGALLVLALAAGLLARRARRLRRARAAAPADWATREIAEALRRTRRRAAPDLTLVAVEELVEGSPEAVAYLRAVRRGRYGGGAADWDPRGRRALRRELARGLGVAGRLRALRAMPPHLAEYLPAGWQRAPALRPGA